MLGFLGLQHHFLARSGNVNGQSLAAQLPRLQIGLPDVLDGGVRGEVAGLGDGVVDKALQHRLHLDVLFGSDILGNHKNAADLFRNLFDSLDGSLPPHLFIDAVSMGVVQARFLQHLVKHRAGVGEFPLPLILPRRLEELSHIGEGEHRFAAVPFRPGNGGNRSGGGDRCLRPVPNTVLFDSGHHSLPIDLRPPEIPFVGIEGRRRLPNQLLWIIDRTLDRQEGFALPGEIDRGAHRMVADEFHDLRRQLQPILPAIGNSESVHRIGQSHDP